MQLQKENKSLTVTDCIQLQHLLYSNCIPAFQVDAYPAAVTFSWYFNNSEHKEAINDKRFSANVIPFQYLTENDLMAKNQPQN